MPRADDRTIRAPSGLMVGEALRAAEDLCAKRSERMTAPRRRVLELLLRAGQPLKAYDLVARFGPKGAQATPTTVYRALEFLERMHLVHRIDSLGAYTPCRLDRRDHNVGFLICDRCGAVEEFEPEVSPDLEVARAARYDVRAVTVEAHGLCPACRSGIAIGHA